jgi:hypothetical protein
MQRAPAAQSSFDVHALHKTPLASPPDEGDASGPPSVMPDADASPPGETIPGSLHPLSPPQH